MTLVYVAREYVHMGVRGLLYFVHEYPQRDNRTYCAVES